MATQKRKKVIFLSFIEGGIFTPDNLLSLDPDGSKFLGTHPFRSAIGDGGSGRKAQDVDTLIDPYLQRLSFEEFSKIVREAAEESRIARGKISISQQGSPAPAA